MLGEFCTLDIDLKARFVTSEELSHALGKYIKEGSHADFGSKPSSWWDRHCDLSLLIEASDNNSLNSQNSTVSQLLCKGKSLYHLAQ